jgi:hypothetical protein
MKVRIAALIALLVGIGGLVAIGGWWYVKDHVRISQASLQRTVASRDGATSATCDRKDPNAAHWLCAVTTAGQPERCIKVHVRPWGSVDLINGYLKCEQDPALASFFSAKKKKTKPAA